MPNSRFAPLKKKILVFFWRLGGRGGVWVGGGESDISVRKFCAYKYAAVKCLDKRGPLNHNKSPGRGDVIIQASWDLLSNSMPIQRNCKAVSFSLNYPH